MPEMTREQVTATLQDGSELATPWWRIDAGRPGPALLVMAAQHGNEVQGSEVIRRFAPVCADGLVSGEVLLVPIANRLAVRHRRNSVKIGPEEKQTDRHKANNMNRLWPGDPDGNDIARVAFALHEALVTRATHVVDLHCWCHFWAAATLGCDDGGDSRRMAEATGTRFTRWSEPDDEVTLPTQIRRLMVQRGGGAVTLEFSGQYCVREREVQTGVRAVTNVAKTLGLLDGEPEVPEHSGIEPAEESTTPVEAPCSGLFVEQPGLQVEDRVEAGQRLGHILRDDDLSTVEICAPVGGWLWRFGSHRGDPDVSLADQHPYSDPGDTLASLVI